MSTDCCAQGPASSMAGVRTHLAWSGMSSLTSHQYRCFQVRASEQQGVGQLSQSYMSEYKRACFWQELSSFHSHCFSIMTRPGEIILTTTLAVG